MAWAVIVSVLVMTILSLLRINVIIAIIAAGLTAGLMNGESFKASVEMLVNGMGDQASVALSYVLLGAFAVAISYSGITALLVNYLLRALKSRRTMIVFVIAFVASLSQNVIPVHIAFIPILIPPLLKLFDEMKLDRRAVAAALTFGLKAPYVMIPVGFGFLFHETIQEAMNANGISLGIGSIAQSLLIPGSGMVVGLFIAVLITYRKKREAPVLDEAESVVKEPVKSQSFQTKHVWTILAILVTLFIQAFWQNLILAALAGIIIMFIFRVVPFAKGDKVVNDGIGMMGFIAFVMLVASGYANVLTKTESVSALVEISSDYIGDNQAVIAFILLLVGLVVTMGIGSSFATVPILAALFVPICVSAGFSPMATAALIGTAGALGDAGSPASDSTLGPTSGLNADGRHNHIWDTCVPTFLHYNIPLFIFGWAAALIL
ncbi:sodium:proton antiporter [Halobacillus halophilus]|uniref:Na+/H+ antiporter family protein n=1 Tax=Halobacillus halophilus (strain ATCC 35676 / DSM 2266 / JCM 20832 / KCTC 3685 / LMG 17431 / NBRC 102448 / NCIMB 2269) TaxID=866895 RepID=I0JJB1_HALH3|nr:Na+/H+ antiporter NhaC family protein [Halobacillus halophilus]ASF38387.1 sodium:proton antiporter [Halobacillus halophilus]CCG44229.1 Na+/H+ antiporter family protein [Halobacillus halophilus DSM 2266]